MSPLSALLPVRRPTPDPSERADLRVVEEQPRWSWATYLSVLSLSLLFLVLFGLAVFHTVLVGAQGRLDRLDERIEAETQRQHDLRLQVAQLESPERVVERARNDLGMVTPDDVIWLSPVESPADGGGVPR